MSPPLPPRRKADPLALPRQALMPQGGRSRAALGLAAMAAQGRFALQICAACGAAQYPPRDVCHECLGTELPWRDVPTGAALLGETTVHLSGDTYFRVRTPWRTGLVALDCGPSAVAHVHPDVAPAGRARMSLRLDRSGQGVLLALPERDSPNMMDDPMIREMTCDPRGRRILVTDGRSAFGQEAARSLLAAGAAQVFLGIADGWKPFKGQDNLPGDAVQLDLTDATSVSELAAEFGGRIDIVVNTALHIRPGGPLDRRDLVSAREEMEVAYFGPLRLAQALGPTLRARAADGPYGACAWVNIHGIDALAPAPGFALTAAAQAAGLSLSQSLRTSLAPIRVLTAFVGPLEDEWHQAIPPPKVTPTALAAAIVRGLREGLEEITVGDIAMDVMRRWRDNPSTLARERAG
ncbi:MAG: SDR family NAD(P)-dependent oxidoreductase [Alphaproteobacteria bacterium]|nr:SDR family NAD(P)-dependent oxidoreductase [Alphaproteobacteria bacterium]